jgi:predicted permease
MIAIALRRLRQSPVFALFSVVTLALGIGVTTAAYSAMYALFGRSMGIRASDRIVYVTRSSTVRRDYPVPVSWSDLDHLSSQQRSFATLASSVSFGTALSNRDASQLVTVEAASGDYFELLGVGAALGRTIQRADDRADAPSVVVLSESTWRSRFNGDPRVIGSTVKLANHTLDVIGVAPVGFRGTRTPFVSGLAGWVPLATARRLGFIRRESLLTILARLTPSATVESAAVEVATIGARLDEAAPLPPTRQTSTSAPAPVRRSWSATSLDDYWSGLNSGEAMRLFMALPALVLLVAGTNLANLILSRGVSRRHEFAVRAALGASRWRLVREELVEAAVIALAGGALGIVATDALLRWATSVLREPIAALAPDFALNWHLEPAVFAAAGTAVLLVLVVAGLLPALQLTRPAPARALAADVSGALPRWRGRSNLIALQVGVSVGLFLITAVCVRFIVQPPSRRYGASVDLTRLALAAVPFARQQYDEARGRRAIDAVLDDLRRSPEIERATAATSLPLVIPGLREASTPVVLVQPGEPCPVRQELGMIIGMINGGDAEKIGVSPGLLETLGLAPQVGRTFDERDRAGTDPVVVLNQTLARTVFGQPNAVGRAVTMCPQERWSGPGAAITSATVVGVVPDGDLMPNGRAYARVYAPLAQHYESAVTFLARAREGDGRAAVAAIKAAIRRADPELAVQPAGRADVMVGGPAAFLGFVAATTGGMATLALALAMAGLYGVLSHVVGKRRREMGLRVALGASQARIVRLILKDGLRPIAEGVFIGLGAAIVIRYFMQMGLEGRLAPIDAAMFLLAVVPLAVAGFAAAYLPARRAASVDPSSTLKDL